MFKKHSVIAASVVIVAFLFVSITHACSGLTPMNSAVQQSPMTMGDNNSPCSKETADPCQSVRDSMLSVKPALSAANTLRQTFALQLSFVDSPIPIASLPAASTVEGAFPPAFQPPLTVSHVVLRI